MFNYLNFYANIYNMNINITDLGSNGEGIGRINDKVCFVPFSLPNEICDIEIIKDNKNFNTCKLTNIISPSTDRTNPKCKYFYMCGGCNLQHYKYTKQLEFKTKLVQNCFNKNYKLNKVIVNNTISSKEFNYRNKMVFPTANINNETIVGMFKSNSHKIVEIDYCEIASKKINDCLQSVKLYIKKYNIEGYNFTSKTGYLKYIVIREINKKISLTFVVNNNNNSFKNLNEIYADEIYLNVNKSDKEILSNNLKLIYGKKINLKENNLLLEITPNTFMQVNNYIKDKIYLDTLNLINKKIVINAYSGAGMLSAMLSRKAEFVYGIEINISAHNDAENLIKTNKIKNVKNICGDCLLELPNLVNFIKQNFALVIDPPRTGVYEKILQQINEIQSCKDIIYISCNPSTLTRDLNYLTNYIIKVIQPYDMFPQTSHCENLVVLERI